MAPEAHEPPIDGLEACVHAGRWDSGEDTFRVLRRLLLSSGESEIERWTPESRQLTWSFLLEFCRRRKVYKRQVVECLSVLSGSPVWREDYSGSLSLQASAEALPEDVRAAVALQHDVLAKSLSAKAAQALKPESVPTQLRVEDVTRSVAAFREADRLRTAKLQECEGGDASLQHPSLGVSSGASTGDASDFGSTTASLAGALATCPAAVASAAQLREGIEAVLDIDTPQKMEGDAIRAFTKLRRGCLHTVHWPEALDAEAAQAPGVLNFLVDVAKRYRLRLKQVCEVLNILMAAESWVTALRSSTDVMRRLREELPEDAQAVLAVQHEELLHVITPAAAEQAAAAMVDETPESEEASAEAEQNPIQGGKDEEEESAEVEPLAPPTVTVALAPGTARAPVPTASFSQELADAREVAREMKKMRRGLQVDFLRSIEVRAIDKEGTPIEVTLEQKADLALAAATEAATKATVAADWREARAPNGKRYYYHIVTRVSRWDKPKDIPVPTWEAGGFKIGDPMEVYSSSRKVWCKGVVESLTATTAVVAYRLPGAAGSDLLRKELPFDHADLRRRDATLGAAAAEGEEEDAPGPPPPEAPREDDEEEAALLSVVLTETMAPGSFMPPTATVVGALKAVLEDENPGAEASGERGVWSSAEAASFQELFRAAKGPGKVDADAVEVQAATRQLQQSALPQKALKEVWEAAMVDCRQIAKQSLTKQEFYMCCRLVNHCLAMAKDPARGHLVSEGGKPLRDELEICASRSSMG